MPKHPSVYNKNQICPQRMELAQLMVDVTSDYSQTLEHKSIDLEVDVPHGLWFDLDAVVMRDAVRKIIDNAIEAMPQGGMLVITSLITRKGLIIEFADSGPGVSEELKHRLFEPFATTKHDHAGLGLSIVRDVVRAHGGAVDVQDCPEGGTAITIELPLIREQRMAA